MGNPYVSGLPWSGTTYATGPDPWNGQPTDVLPAANFFTPGATLPAEELNYNLNQLGNAILYLNSIVKFGLVTMVTSATGSFSTNSLSSIDIPGLSVNLTTNPGDLVVCVLNTFLSSTATGEIFVAPEENVGGGTFSGIGSAAFGQLDSLTGTGFTIRGPAIDAYVVTGATGATSSIKGTVFTNGVTGTVNYSALTVFQFRAN